MYDPNPMLHQTRLDDLDRAFEPTTRPYRPRRRTRRFAAAALVIGAALALGVFGLPAPV